MLYNKLKEAIFKADPELEKEVLELKFGCRINIRDDKNVLFVKMDDEYIYWIDSDINNCDEDSLLLKDLNFEILGRPLTLEDVLRALDKKGDYSVDGAGDIYQFFSNELSWIRLNINWQLGKTLEEQSEQVKKELLKLLS